MYSNQRIFVVGLILFLCGTVAEGENNGEELGTFNGNQIYWTNNDRNQDTIDIDDKPTGSVYYSGDDGFDDRQYDDTEVDSMASGMEDNEGSGYAPEDSCIHLQKQMQSKPLQGFYIPRCTPSGDFEQVQCQHSLSQCWCVDKGGREIAGSRRQTDTGSSVFTCDPQDNMNGIVLATQRPGVNSRPGEENRDDIVELPNENDHLPEEDLNKQRNNEIDNSIDAMPDGDIDIQTLPPNNNEVEGMMSSKGEEYLHEPSAVMKKPGILAGIIGGAVIGLLCAVLLVMFIVYRMRKKDEGSYALDEKRSPSHHTYQRANTREFYA